MIATLKLQYRYLLSKVSFWFLLVNGLLLTVGILIASGFHSERGLLDINRITMFVSYQTESIMILKFSLMIVTVFLVIQGYYSQLCKYHLFFLQKTNGKIHLGLAKTITIMIIQAFFGLYGGVTIHLVGLYITPFFRLDFDYINALLSMILEMFILGLVGSVFMQIIDSIFSGLIPLILFWMVEVNTDYLSIIESNLIKSLYAIVANPIFDEGQWILLYSVQHYLILFVFLWILNLSIFMLKDIKS